MPREVSRGGENFLDRTFFDFSGTIRRLVGTLAMNETTRTTATNDCGPIITRKPTLARSYLLRYNPVGLLKYSEFRHFKGSVTFDRPVPGRL